MVEEEIRDPIRNMACRRELFADLDHMGSGTVCCLVLPGSGGLTNLNHDLGGRLITRAVLISAWPLTACSRTADIHANALIETTTRSLTSLLSLATLASVVVTRARSDVDLLDRCDFAAMTPYLVIPLFESMSNLRAACLAARQRCGPHVGDRTSNSARHPRKRAMHSLPRPQRRGSRSIPGHCSSHLLST